MTTKFEQYAAIGEGHDVMDALRLLTEAYIDQCGISLTCRTVIYYAAERWHERLAWLDLPLSEMARKEALYFMMRHYSKDYDPEVYDEYDITGLDNAELKEYCISMLDEYDDATCEVLCWGIADVCRESTFVPRELCATASDGTELSGVLKEQSCASTYIKMTKPYNLHGGKYELVREAETLLVTMYDDYNKLKANTNQLKDLYVEYNERCINIDVSKPLKKYRLFMEVFAPVLDDNTILADEEFVKTLINTDSD